MIVERNSHCKVNLLLNILGKRADGFHELETLMYPVWACDTLSFERVSSGISLSCTDPTLPVDRGNLVYRAAEAFVFKAGIGDGVRIHLEKKLPLSAGLGGGSGNAACTLLGLNELFGEPLSSEEVYALAGTLGSDVAFFTQDQAALAFGRGEIVEPLGPLPALENGTFIIVHPGFGISTPWAYKELARFPKALHGTKGRARELALALAQGRLEQSLFYNALEEPALEKYPLLGLFQEFFRSHGAVSLMSGSGSSTFALVSNTQQAEEIVEAFRTRFGTTNWLAVVPCAKPGPPC